MLFSSMSFLFIFLPIVGGIHYLAPQRFRNDILLLASFVFYGWGEPRYLAIMLLTILVNHYGAIIVETFRRQALFLLLIIIALNLSVLGYFKYFNFFLSNLELVFSFKADLIKVVMPIGISFYTFQALSYVIDVYKEEVPVQEDIHKTALYIALFPQLVAGPIVKYHDIADQLDNRVCSHELVAKGIERFIIGLSKKVLIANTLGIVADKVFALPANSVDTWVSWVGAICYSFQLFFDFSGYSDMAIGLGLMFGFRFLENFNYPYISSSITEFWRRWHISLSTWLKLYLYIPLGGNRKGLTRTCINLLMVFFVTGFWHGAAWTFIVWGLWHGVIIVIEKLTNWHKRTGAVPFMIFKHALTLLFFVIGWVMVRVEPVGLGFDCIDKMLGVLTCTVSVVIYGT